ncbi:hypothetical protein LTR85_011678 [Meristemomyces frigidus]|nr:hypothetical protein LTR85_011678 [Meristemomyces frigidus]
MDLKVDPAQEADMDDLMDVQFSAFDKDPYHEALYPGDPASAETRKAAGRRTLEEWRADPSIRFMKCTDGQTGQIIGYAKWNLYEAERPKEEWAHRPDVDWCSGRTKEIAESFLYATVAMREKHWVGMPHLLLSILCVHQGHQRKGAGTSLVGWGLRLAEGLHLPVSLEASLAGFPLYSSLGFHQVDTIIIKAIDWDGNYDRHYAVMLKPLEESSLVKRASAQTEELEADSSKLN